jgi:hypothetical protein
MARRRSRGLAEPALPQLVYAQALLCGMSSLVCSQIAREDILLKLEAILRDMAKNDKALYDSYSPEAEFVIQTLRTSPDITED